MVEIYRDGTYITFRRDCSMAEKKKAITPSNLARDWGVGLKAVKDAIVKAGILLE